MKIAVITCYKFPDYIRARALRASLATIDGVEVTTIKNSSTGIKRYPEVIWKILKIRFSQKPDVYLLTFRGYEMLPIVRILTVGKKLIFDELINLIEGGVYEHHKLSGLPAWLLATAYRLCLLSCGRILADTETHADISSAISKIDRRKYTVVPVSTDESVFTYQPYVSNPNSQSFQVFFYGYMRPLHGPQYVIQAAEILKDNPNINFVIGGRIGDFEQTIKDAQGRGARIQYRQWIPFEELPELVRNSAINIAGPFGDTFQSQHVINGKTYQFLASGNVALIGSNKNTELFVNHVNSLVVPQGDANAIVREILWAYDNQAQLPAIAEAGRRLYDEKFSNQVIAGDLQKMLEKL